jgi:phage portal protein BeeE
MALWDLLETKTVSPAAAADATARSLAAGPRAGLAIGNGAPMAADNVKAVIDGHYRRVLWVFRCVDAIAQAECSLPIYAWTSHDDDATRADGFDHIERLLNGPDRPNPGEEYWQLRYRISSLLLLSTRGVFVEVVRDKDTGDPAMLSILDPDAVEILPDTGKKVRAYRVRYANAKGLVEQKELKPEQVMWIRGRPHPQDPYAQVTPLMAAGLSADTDYLARVFNANWLRNDGRQSQLIALKADNGMNPTDVDQIKRMFGGGVARAGETRVVEADDISVAQVGGSPADAQYNNLLNGTKQDILEAFGISDPFLAYAANRTWDNAGVELYSTWSGTMRWHCKAFASGFMPLVREEGSTTSNTGVVLAHDFAKVPELQKPANDRADRAQASWTAGTATLDEVRIAQGRKPFEVPLAQVVWTTSGPIGPDEKTQQAAQDLIAAIRPAPAALPPGDDGTGGALPPGGGGAAASGGGAPSAADVQGLASAVQAAMNQQAATNAAAPAGAKALTAARGRLGSPERKAVTRPRAPRRRGVKTRRDDVIDGEVVGEEVESPAETATRLGRGPAAKRQDPGGHPALDPQCGRGQGRVLPDAPDRRDLRGAGRPVGPCRTGAGPRVDPLGGLGRDARHQRRAEPRREGPDARITAGPGPGQPAHRLGGDGDDQTGDRDPEADPVDGPGRARPR